jgi:hypothetical protein
MIAVPSGVRVWLAVGRTDMRKGMNGLALQVQQVLGREARSALESKGAAPNARLMSCNRSNGGGMAREISREGQEMDSPGCSYQDWRKRQQTPSRLLRHLRHADLFLGGRKSQNYGLRAGTIRQRAEFSAADLAAV